MGCFLLAVGTTVLLAGTPSAGAAQDTPNQGECRRVLTDLFGVEGADVPCLVLGGNLVIPLTTEFYTSDDVAGRVIPPAAVQPAQSGDAQAAGSLGQGEAAPTIQPMALGGGSVSAVGSDAGSDAIVAVALNPTIFWGDGEAGEGMARGVRTTDLTLYFPANRRTDATGDDIDYFGARLRVNFTGLSAGSTVWDEAERLLRDRVTEETRAAQELGGRFRVMPPGRIAGCAEAIRDSGGEPGPVIQACGEDILPRFDEEGYREFRQALAPIRAQADSRYFGLDLRFEVGDPTLGAVPDAHQTAVTAGASFGKQFVGEDPEDASAGIRARAGVRYADPRDLDDTMFAFDGGISFVGRRPIDLEHVLTVTAGFEGRAGGGVAESEETALQSDYLTFSSSLSLPVTDRFGISVGFSQPVIGDGLSQALSVTADWRLLFPGLLSTL